MRQCIAKNARGSPCGFSVMTGHSYCYHHSPDTHAVRHHQNTWKRRLAHNLTEMVAVLAMGVKNKNWKLAEAIHKTIGMALDKCCAEKNDWGADWEVEVVFYYRPKAQKKEPIPKEPEEVPEPESDNQPQQSPLSVHPLPTG